MVLKENLGVILLTAIGVVASVLIILIVIEKELYKKILRFKNDRNRYYFRELTNMNQTAQKEILDNVDQIAKNFFKESFGIKPGADYSKLKTIFTKNKNLEAAKFCGLMNDILYTGKEPNKEDNQKLMVLLAEIIKNNKILTEEEKEEMKQEKMKQEKIQGYLNKVKIFGVRNKEVNKEQNNSK